MTKKQNQLLELSVHLKILLDRNPFEAVKQAREIDLDTPECWNLMQLRGAVLVDGGVLTHQQDAIEEGLELFQHLHQQFPNADVTYNLANGLVAAAGNPPRDPGWLDHQENTWSRRARARQCYWKVAQDQNADPSIQTQALTNLANQFSNSYRLGEAHDTRLAALKVDPQNGVAAASAARDLMWLFERGGCSDVTRVEAIMLAKIADRHHDRVADYAGSEVAKQIAAFASQLVDPPPPLSHSDPFISWLEHERLTLAPVVELVNPDLGKLDWLTLPGILERKAETSGMPPPVFAMFNVLKSDFILARDLTWRATEESVWPRTGIFADTLDYATYGPDTSALILAHRTALDLLDKVAVTANSYFNFGQPPDKVYFGKLWRGGLNNGTCPRPLAESVEATIRSGVGALYGLVELADDYSDKAGILRPQKDLRNTGTHRFIVLHDMGDPKHSRQAPEIEHHCREKFYQDVLRSLRIARSAIQMQSLSMNRL